MVRRASRPAVLRPRGLLAAAGGGSGSSAVWNSADKTGQWGLSNGDLTATWTGAGLGSVRATPGVLSGEKKVWATKITARNSATDHYVGVTNASQSITSIAAPYYLTRMDGTAYSGGGTASGSISSFAVNDIEMWAYDYTAKTLWRGVNGTWSNSGDPAAGTGYMMLFTSADEFKPLVQSFNNMAIDLLVGTNYPYSIPSGFTSL